MENQTKPSNSVFYIKEIVKLIGFILVFVAAVMAIFAFNAYTKDIALDNCTHVTRVESTQDNGATKYTYPDAKLYDACLQRIGMN